MKSIITEISVTSNVTLITLINIPSNGNTLSSIFNALSSKNLNIDMISITPPQKDTILVSFTLNDEDLFAAINVFKDFKTTIPNLRFEVNSNNVKLSLFGEQMKFTPGTAAHSMSILSDEEIDIKLITTSEVDISYLIYDMDRQRAIDAFSKAYEHFTIIEND